MKSFLRSIQFALVILGSAASLFFSSCAKETGCTDPKALNFNPNAKESSGDCQYATTQATAKATLALEIHQHLGTADFDTATIYTLANGQRCRMSTLRYYLSNFRLVKSDNSEVLIPESYLLVQPSQLSYSLPEVEPGTYTKLKFYVGIDAAANSAGVMPVDRPAGHPLGLQNPSMFWSWSTGYIFMKCEGYCDTTTTGMMDQNFSWHLGENTLLREVEINLNNLVFTASQTTNLHIKSDLNEILKTIDFRTEKFSHTMDNRTLAIKIADQSVTMFSVK
jgi:hypothetical protein